MAAEEEKRTCYDEKAEAEIQKCMTALRSSARVYTDVPGDCMNFIRVPAKMMADDDFVHALAGVHTQFEDVALCDMQRWLAFCRNNYAVALAGDDDERMCLNGVVMGGINIVVGWSSLSRQDKVCACGREWPLQTKKRSLSVAAESPAEKRTKQ